MALTLEQYATHLDTRGLPWPVPPPVDRPKAKPHVVRIKDLRAVTWSIYGTLLTISGGDLQFESPQKLLMSVALDKTLQEFKFWGSMTRKPGQPADYLQLLYTNILTEQRTRPSTGEKFPEILAENLWEALLKKLLQKDYKYDIGMYGGMGEYSKKIAYFFHSSLQGTGCYPGAAVALREVAERGLAQGVIAHAQCFTTVQVQRGLTAQNPDAQLDLMIHPELRALSCEVRGRKPSERLFRHILTALDERGIAPEQVLHVGASIPLDVVPARKLGMRTGLFAGDKASLQATVEQLKEPTSRPDILLTELEQIADAIG